MATTTTHYGLTKPGQTDYVAISVLNNNFDSIDNIMFQNSKAMAMIADAYDNTATYAVGAYCIYNYGFYKCTTAVTTAENFDSTKWTQTTVAAELLAGGTA